MDDAVGRRVEVRARAAAAALDASGHRAAPHRSRRPPARPGRAGRPAAMTSVAPSGERSNPVSRCVSSSASVPAASMAMSARSARAGSRVKAARAARERSTTVLMERFDEVAQVAHERVAAGASPRSIGAGLPVGFADDALVTTLGTDAAGRQTHGPGTHDEHERPGGLPAAAAAPRRSAGPRRPARPPTPSAPTSAGPPSRPRRHRVARRGGRLRPRSATPRCGSGRLS